MRLLSNSDTFYPFALCSLLVALDPYLRYLLNPGPWTQNFTFYPLHPIPSLYGVHESCSSPPPGSLNLLSALLTRALSVWPCLVSRVLLTRLALYYIIPRPSSLPSYTGRTSSTSVRFTLYTSPWSSTFNLQLPTPPINNQLLLQQLLQQHPPPLTYHTSYVLQLLRLYDSTRRAPLTRPPTPSTFHNLI